MIKQQRHMYVTREQCCHVIFIIRKVTNLLHRSNFAANIKNKQNQLDNCCSSQCNCNINYRFLNLFLNESTLVHLLASLAQSHSTVQVNCRKTFSPCYFSSTEVLEVDLSHQLVVLCIFLRTDCLLHLCFVTRKRFRGYNDMAIYYFVHHCHSYLSPSFFK